MQTQTRRKLLPTMIRQRELIFMSIPIVVYVFIFSYLPLRGWEMAFQHFRPGRAEQEWVGLQHFRFLFTDAGFFRIMRNTLAMSFINLVLGFACSIFLALMINEIRKKAVKRVVQTISYLPHFLSWVVACSLIANFLAGDGILNVLMMRLGIIDQPNIFLANPDYFWWIVGWSNVWKSVGWNTIIYLAAITAIDPELYESAELDGAGRFARMWHITLPGIKSTILVLVIMNIGWILNAGFEVQWLLHNGLTIDVAETIDVFVIRWGINMRNYSLATALGMFKTVVSIVLIVGANQLSKRFAQESLV
ncbi:MAG: ABC transporter permease subunit [Defluviitaleaceae bacterium]|nr:ABC transporter permease subunit [Defluviitaleaceae bacterium]MCL2835407.1 ABC transporter permease subunit [Defluviitaleaceae bacterium]